MVFQQLHYFIAVAECGSINGAAERLFISQQSLRASINSLEQKLGFALFYRSAKGMRLTEAGAVVRKDVEQILAMEADWERFAAPNLTEPATVHIVASPLVYSAVLTDLVVECRASYPNLRPMIYCAREDELLSQLSHRAIGVIGSAPSEVIRHKLRPFAAQNRLAIETFGLDQFCVYLNRTNPLADQPYLTLEQLGGLVLAAYPEEDKRFHYRAIYRHFSSAAPFFIEKQENIFQMIAEMPDVAAVFPHLAVKNNVYVQRGQVTAMVVKDFPMPAISCMFSPALSTLTPAEKIITAAIRRRFLALTQELEDFGLDQWREEAEE